LINTIIKINSITLKNVNIFFSINKIFKEFIEYFYVFLIDFFFKYNQFILNVRNRNMITFIILLKFLRIIILSQKVINSIIQFVRIIITILKNVFFKVVILFLNNVKIKEFYTNYNNKLILSKIRRFVFKYI
ncbi:hypothetical protein BDZ45DRAFT_608838, partial [Acephala macrosclerotiorum]